MNVRNLSMWQHSGLSEVQTMSEYIERGALLEEVESLTNTVTGMITNLTACGRALTGMCLCLLSSDVC